VRSTRAVDGTFGGMELFEGRVGGGLSRGRRGSAGRTSKRGTADDRYGAASVERADEKSSAREEFAKDAVADGRGNAVKVWPECRGFAAVTLGAAGGGSALFRSVLKRWTRSSNSLFPCLMECSADRREYIR
jgi:hypothetical protein